MIVRVGSVLLAAAGLVGSAAVGQTALKPVGLRSESLVEPLGMDEAAPRLSWRLSDSRWGAKQTAYEINVWSKRPQAADAKGDAWDSGRVSSSQSSNVAYAGAKLAPMTRYYWRVKAWDQDGKPYPASELSWFETGLMGENSWQAQWIGYEGQELHSVRESGAQWISNAAQPGYTQSGDTHHDFRTHFTAKKPVKQAVLFTTGEDTAAAWVNGKPVLAAAPLNAWMQMPWGTYEAARRDLRFGDGCQRDCDRGDALCGASEEDDADAHQDADECVSLRDVPGWLDRGGDDGSEGLEGCAECGRGVVPAGVSG